MSSEQRTMDNDCFPNVTYYLLSVVLNEDEKVNPFHCV